MKEQTIITSSVLFKSSVAISGETKHKLILALNELKGITNVEFPDKGIYIEYYSQLISTDTIRFLLAKNSFQFEVPKKRGFFNRFINKIAKDNIDEFGTEGPHCCG